MTRAAVIGGGISGLVAARRILDADHDAEVTVLESRDRLGGCLKTSDLGGHVPEGADVGAEASLFVRPETARLCAELGLDPVFPDPAQSSRLCIGGRMHAMPRGTLMGVPAEPTDLRGLVSEAGLARIAAERLGEWNGVGAAADGVRTNSDDSGADFSVGEFLAHRLGDELVDTVVDPLLGGVYAGRCRQLSLAATIPALLPAARQGTSVLDAVAEVQARKQAAPGGNGTPGGNAVRGGNVPGAQDAAAAPVFMSLPGGIAGLVEALTDSLAGHGADLRTGASAESLHRTSDGGWRVELEDGGTLSADIVVLAVPAFAAERLLAEEAPEIASELATIEYASSALVTVVIDVSDEPLEGSGFLVPITEDAFIKASTFASNKWPWMKERIPDGTAVVRMSVGRFGDAPELWSRLDDAELARRAIDEWRRLAGHGGEVLHSEVQRWDRALPQYFPGHLGRIERVDAALDSHAGLALVGSAYDGVGIPACIGRADREIARLLGSASRAGATHGSSMSPEVPPEKGSHAP